MCPLGFGEKMKLPMTSSAQDTALPSLGKVRPISHKSRKKYVTDKILWPKVKLSVFPLGTKVGVKRDTVGLGEFLVGLWNVTCTIQFLLHFLPQQASGTRRQVLVWAGFYEM